MTGLLELAFWVALVAVAALAALGVIRPFLAGRAAGADRGLADGAAAGDDPSPVGRAEVRRLLTLLSELEYDRAMQKLDPGDYARLKAQYQQAVAAHLGPHAGSEVGAVGTPAAAKRGPGTGGARPGMGEEKPE